MTYYVGRERREKPRPVSRFQRLMDIAFHHARRVERTSTEVPLVDSMFLFLTPEPDSGIVVVESEAPNASRPSDLQRLRKRNS